MNHFTAAMQQINIKPYFPSELAFSTDFQGGIKFVCLFYFLCLYLRSFDWVNLFWWFFFGIKKLKRSTLFFDKC